MPWVRITVPAESRIKVPAITQVEAKADLGGQAIEQIEFSIDDELVFVDDTESYVFEWQNRRVGKFVFTVTAKGGDGEAVESSGVEFEFVAKRRSDDAALIAECSRWLYLDTGEPPNEQWAGGGFDDAHWLEGSAQLDYGEGDEGTGIRFGENPREKHVTTWFRKTITVEDVSRFDGLKLRLLSDDGALIFLNDRFVARESVGQVGLLFQSAPVFVLVRPPVTDEQGSGVRVFHASPCELG